MIIERILVTPRWGGTIEDDWYPWLSSQHPLVERIELPNASAPTPEGCAAMFRAALARGNPARTIVIGHSVSCQGWLHALAGQVDALAGFLGVAAWWSVDRPWPTIEPWLRAELDDDALRCTIAAAHVVLGTNDPFTSDQEENARLWRERLGATVDIVEDGKHFNVRQAPSVLVALHQMLAR